MDVPSSERTQTTDSKQSSFYLKSAKFFTSLSLLFLVGWMVCSVATFVQFVRGFFDYSQWLFMIAWMFAGGVCKFVGGRCRATGQQYMRDGIDAGQIAINEHNEAVANVRGSSST